MRNKTTKNPKYKIIALSAIKFCNQWYYRKWNYRKCSMIFLGCIDPAHFIFTNIKKTTWTNMYIQCEMIPCIASREKVQSVDADAGRNPLA